MTAHSKTAFNLCRIFTAATNLQFVLRIFNHDIHFGMLEILGYFQQTSVNYSLLTDKCKSLPHLLALEIYTIPENSVFEKMCKYLPQNLQELALDIFSEDSVLTDYQVSMLSNALKELHNLTSLVLSTNNISENGIKTVVGAIKSNENLCYLDLTLSADTLSLIHI